MPVWEIRYRRGFLGRKTHGAPAKIWQSPGPRCDSMLSYSIRRIAALVQSAFRRDASPMPSTPDSVRLLLCARCRKQVIICRQCDHNEIYCEGECREIRRRETVRRAAEKYQATSKGALQHAESQERYRHKKAKRLAAASPPAQHQDGGQEPEIRAPAESPTGDSPALGLPCGLTELSDPSGPDTSPSFQAAGTECENDNPGSVATLFADSGDVAIVVPAETHQSSADHHSFSAGPEQISLEDEGLEKIVTHHTSPEDADGVRLCALARVAGSSGASAGQSAAGSTPRKPRSVSHCHFCGRPASGFVRFGFLGSMEVP